MGDFSNNKPRVGGNYPLDVSNIDNTGAAGFTRVEDWPTPERLKGEFLFGIPLIDFKTRQQMPDEAIKSIIRRAAARVETECRIDVFPVQRVVRKDFDRTKYLQGWSQIDTGYKNITAVQEVSIRAVNSEETHNNHPSNETDPFAPEGSVLYRVPLSWIDLTYGNRGMIHFVPLQTTFTGTGIAGGSTLGAAAPLFAVFSKLQWIPSFWFIRFTAGFQENSIPLPIWDLICTFASIEILSQLSALNKYNSQSMGMDGISQGISSPGPQLYTKRIEELQQKATELTDLIRSRFTAKFKMDYI